MPVVAVEDAEPLLAPPAEEAEASEAAAKVETAPAKAPEAAGEVETAPAEAPEASGNSAKPPQEADDSSGPLKPTEAQVKALAFVWAKQSNFGRVRGILDEWPQLWEATDEEGHTLLHWAALNGNLDFVKVCHAHGCPPDPQARNKQTPLMWAVIRGHLDVCRELLDASANVRHSDSVGATPLILAVQHKMHACLLLLMRRGKEVLLQDTDVKGCSAVHWAAYKGDTYSLRLLDYFGADLQAIDQQGMLPIHRATSAAHIQAIEFLVEKRSDPMVRTKDGKSCMDIAGAQSDPRLHNLFKKLAGQRLGPEVEDVEKVDDGEKKKKGSRGSELMMSISKDKAGQKIFPVFWTVCVALATFEYLMDIRATSYQVAPTAALLFEIGVPTSMALFAYVALSDPGRIPTGIKGKSGVEEVMRTLDTPAGGADPQAVIDRLCLTTFVLKDLRTKYCTQTGACVSEFDHYCVWLNTAIGRGNHRIFVILAIVEGLTQVTHIYLCWTIASALVPYKGGFFSWFWLAWTMYPLLMFMLLVQCLTLPFVVVLLAHQTRLIVQNLTTNEMMNMHRYAHFWEVQQISPTRSARTFVNPFHKGSVVKNCLDFWWTRRRSDKGVGWKAPVCGSGGCGHDHGHGDHGSGHGHSHGHSHGHGECHGHH